MTPDEVKPENSTQICGREEVGGFEGLYLPVSEVGRMLKAAMAERNIDKIVAWYLKADELEAMK